jgi:hypothetical protein
MVTPNTETHEAELIVQACTKSPDRKYEMATYIAHGKTEEE